MINIQIDSRKIKKGDIFVAIKGIKVDGHDYINQAIANGAKKIIAEYGNYDIDYEIVSNSYEYLITYLETTYQNEFESIKFIGITGTNGKTTTAYIINQMLNYLGLKTAYIGTIGFYINEEKIKELENTTPDVLELYKIILEAKSYNCKTLVMEVSSHALSQNRLGNLELDIAAFTNLTQDHLDYHKTMKEYLEAKKKILSKLKEEGKIIVNADDKSYQHFLNNQAITIGYNGTDYIFKEIKTSLDKTKIIFDTKMGFNNIETNLTGLFNVYNYMIALAITNTLGYSLNDIKHITNLINPPKGRCETIKYNNNIIVIDYAHTPDAIEKIINTYRELANGKIITIVGCGGDRDSAKRAIMSEITTKLSDKVIFTNDNPRTEDPKKIILDMIYGVTKNNFQIEYDRSKAIKYGIELLEENDILLILGKGHENYQVIGTEKQHFDDTEEVKKLLKMLEI